MDATRLLDRIDRRSCLLGGALVMALVAGLAPGTAIAEPTVVPSARVAPQLVLKAPSQQRPLPPAPAVEPPASPAPIGPAEQQAATALAGRVNAALSSSGATVVTAAVDVQGLGEVVRRDAGRLSAPASTQKSYTGLAALQLLGPGARLRTEVATRAPARTDGRLHGAIWLVAGGDPYLTTDGLRALARQVRALGITVVSGDLLLDDQRYDQRRTADGWKASFMPGQSGPLSALAVDGNRWRSDSTFLADPAFPAAVRFRDLLQAEGVTVTGSVHRMRRPADARTLTTRVSGPMSAVVARVMKDSDNFAAELLLKEVGHVARGEGTSAGGTAAVRDLLGKQGVPFGAAGDGSGLSSLNRQAPVGQVALLAAAAGSPAGPSFEAALSLACRDGTLRRRMCGTAGEGRVAAKTGTLSGVRTLAGYTRTASGRQVRFAFQLSGVTDGPRATAALDAAAVALAGAPE